MSALKNKHKVEESAQFWDVKKAGERLLWRMAPDANGDVKSFKPNDNDLIAVKSVLAWVNRNASGNVSNNQLFAKLYIYFLNQNIRFYETTAFSAIPQKDLSKILSLPLANFYEAFYRDFHGNQVAKIIEENQHERIDSVLKSIEKEFTIEVIKNKLDTMISEALNRFS